jgi:hypothetical protein
MPYKIGWHIPGRVIYGVVSGVQTLDELTEANQTVMSMLDEGMRPVHFIMDDSQLKRTPINLKQLQIALAYVRHTRIGWIVLVGKNNPVLSILVSTLISLMRVKSRRVESLDTAMAFLRTVDNTLTPQRTDNVPTST